MNDSFEILEGDLLISDGKIAGLGKDLECPPATRLLDVSGHVITPGFIQGHVHLGQALFRGLAEDRVLLDWLKDRIWPLEAAHNAASAEMSAWIGGMDCLMGGATTVHDFGLVHGTDAILKATTELGIRAVVGKCMMDTGEGVPPGLMEDASASVAEARELHKTWHNTARGRIQVALTPRFILSCSEEEWRAAVDLSKELGLPLHTHLLESEEEEIAVQSVLGMSQMDFLDKVGVLDTDLRIAHGVWFDENARAVLRERPMSVAHCPSTNLKLASGVADVVFLNQQANIQVGLGCDGAPCNNDMDMLEEMRLAALLQTQKHGPGVFKAQDALALATSQGAVALGLGDSIGSLEVGKAGDVVAIDLNRPGMFASGSLYDRIVYGATRDTISYVLVDGELLVDHQKFVDLDMQEVLHKGRVEINKLLERAEF